MLVFLFRLLSHLPLSALHALGAALGWLVYLASPTYRQRLRNNLERAGYSQHLRASIAEAGKSIAELPFIWCAPPQRVLASVTMVNWELVRAALDARQGVIFLTPHLGCFEVSAQATAVHTRLTVMYRPPRKAALKPLMEGARARGNLFLAPANLGGVRLLLKALKRNETVGVLPDQVPQEGEGVWADFFGRPAYTMTLPARLQQLSRAPIIAVYAERRPRGQGYLLHFVECGQLPEGSPQQQARAINAAMEALIARCPAQYLWSYQRHKAPPGVAGPTAPTDGQGPA
ncbi:MAG TPA: lysophospholipid acyltransferase family protein [Burkholderiaceae bacterium]|nr:lysophospholipid acyltransferase family protein [Burkholderiaceae bacterium]